MVIPLTQKQKDDMKAKFREYLETNKTLADIGKELSLDSTTVGRYFTKFFGEKYKVVSKVKSSQHSTKLTNERVIELFKKYKSGVSMKILVAEVGIIGSALAARMRRLVGKEYYEVAKIRKVIDQAVSRQKVPDVEIKTAFNKYKTLSISLTTLANEFGLAESSLIARFKRLFGDGYKKIALQRRDERKVSKRDYIEAFEKYKTTTASLIDIAIKLGVRISSLRPRFINLFGDEYVKVAKSKLDVSVLNRKGMIAEYLTKEYFKLRGINVKDVRNSAILKGSSKRPDFTVAGAFVEVKCYYVGYSKSRRSMKGYREIVSAYHRKEMKSGDVLMEGVIVSVGSFSNKAIEEARKDGIVLIDHKELRKEFESNRRQDLISLLEEIKPSL